MRKELYVALIAILLGILLIILFVFFWFFFFRGSDVDIYQFVSLEIIEGNYTAWDSASGVAEIHVKRGFDSADIIGFDLIFSFEQSMISHFVNDVLLENSSEVYFISFLGLGGRSFDSVKIVPVFRNFERGSVLSELKIDVIPERDLSNVPLENIIVPRRVSRDKICTLDCSNKQCGPDGCGGSCGECEGGFLCNSSGVCEEESLCAPDCMTRICGSDGCGGLCGKCEDGFRCNSSGVCEEESLCVSNCYGKQCGPDGCGGLCGSCNSGFICNLSGLCEEIFNPTYYVDNRISADCLNYNPATRTCQGGTKRAFTAIQKAANVAVSGDVIAIRAGTYNERVIPVNSGSSGKYITYLGHPGETVYVDGTGVTIPLDEGLFQIKDKSYINVSGLTIRNVFNNVDKFHKTHGIRISSSHYVNVEKNYIYNTCGPGIQTGGSTNIVIDGNEFELNNNGCRGEIISIATTNSFEVKNNHVHNGGLGYGRYSYGGDGGEGIDIKEGSSNGRVYGNIVHDLKEDMGIYVDTYGLTRDVEIFNNIVYNCRDGIILGSESGHALERIRVHHNLIYNNEKRGINIGGFSSFNPEIKNIEVYHNVLYNNGMEGIFSPSERIYSNVTIRNNIFSQNKGSQMSISVPGGFIVSHNLIDGSTTIYGTNHVSGNPRFVSAGTNFRLSSDSPAINKGVSVGLLRDFDNKLRTGVPDIGAFEF
jgi:hypothetical protein